MTIDDLVVDVNDVVDFPDASSLYRPISRHIRTVYRKVGVPEVFEKKFFTSKPKNGIIEIPREVYKIVDVGIGFTGMIETGDYRFHEEVSYTVSRDIIKTNTSSEVTIVALVFPRDSEGSLIIDDNIYDALLNYCIGQILLSKSANVKQDYASLNPSIAYTQQAKRLIDEARAFYSEMRPGNVRELYNLQQNGLL